MCHIVLFSGGSCTVQCGDTSLLVSPGCALLLGPGAWAVSQAGHAQPEMLGCGFPLAVLHEMKNATGEDFLRLFAAGQPDGPLRQRPVGQPSADAAGDDAERQWASRSIPAGCIWR